MRALQEYSLDSNIIVKELYLDVFGVTLEELASVWGEELVKEATDWVPAEESAKVV